MKQTSLNCARSAGLSCAAPASTRATVAPCKKSGFDPLTTGLPGPDLAHSLTTPMTVRQEFRLLVLLPWCAPTRNFEMFRPPPVYFSLCGRASGNTRSTTKQPAIAFFGFSA